MGEPARGVAAKPDLARAGARAQAAGGGATAEPATISTREQRVLEIIETARAKRAKFRDPQITMAHGAGGKATQGLIEGLLLPAFGGAALSELADASEVAVDGAALALTTDSYVVRPLRFPGGSIGGLAVNGTVNDLAVAGARPLALTLSLVLEEGLGAEELRAEVDAVARAARAAAVEIVAGDTKVVERGHADGMYICTTGLGLRDPRARLSPSALRPGDRILLSGSIGEHGMAIMLARDEFELDASIESDSRSLWPAVDALLEGAGPGLHCLRDATRGGVASVLNELARASSVAIAVRESAIPVDPAVAGAAEILGIDPLYVANEGKFLAFVAPDAADAALGALRAVPGCERACEIGEVHGQPPGMVLVETSFGGRRVMDQLVGDPLPRIC
jgi:hydrogenase expression/formation protein HypE